MNAYEDTLRGVQWVMDNRTSYQVAKDLGVTNRTVNRYQNGETPIENMTLATAEKLYNYYLEEMEKMKVKITKVLTNSALTVFALPQNKGEFNKRIKEDNTREIQVIVDENFYKTLLSHPVVMEESAAWYFKDGVEDELLAGIKLHKYEHLSTMNNIHEHEYHQKIVGSDTADYEVSKRLAEPYRNL
jgi:transcriptional regulator with XRE-family HTH domain